MDTFVDERDYRLLGQDKYTFYILRQIMGGETALLRSDHERLIVCFTGHPYPVWIWTPDNASDSDMERAYQLCKDNGLLSGGYHFNMKYSLAEYFTRRADADGMKMKISMNMYAYDCLNPVEPQATDGTLYRCEDSDLEELVNFLEVFHNEVGIDRKDKEGYREDARGYINSGNMYFWKDAKGRNAACCKYAPTGDMASVNLVYTHPRLRRRHYAENLVYQVTLKIIQEGYIPMLYTDADYAASNACYEKIGYVLRGKLCTIDVSMGVC